MEFIQSQQEIDEIQKQVAAALMPYVFDWDDVNNLHMLGGYMRANHVVDGKIDVSFNNIYRSIQKLKDTLVWKVAPSKSQKINYDEFGRPIRDLRAERQQRAAQEARDAREPRKTLEGELKKAEMTAQTNRMIENARDTIASWRGRYHSDTYKFREAATKVLDDAIKNDRTLGGIATAVSKIKALSHEFYRG